MDQYSTAKKQSIYLFLNELKTITEKFISKFKHLNPTTTVDEKFFNSYKWFYISFPSEKLRKVYFDYQYKTIVNDLVKEGHLLNVLWGYQEGSLYFTRIKISWAALHTDWESMTQPKKYKSIGKIKNKLLNYHLDTRYTKVQATSILQECEFKFDDCLTLPPHTRTYQMIVDNCYARYLEVDEEKKTRDEYLKVIEPVFQQIQIWNSMTPLERTQWYSTKRFYDVRTKKLLSNGRIYSFFTRIPKEFRKYITSRELHDLDISACHPHLFCLKINEIDPSINLTNSNFYKLLTKGWLYSYVADRLNIPDGEAKMKVQQWFNCRLILNQGDLNPKHREFAEVFPDIEDIVHKIKKTHGWKYLGYWLSYKESEFMHGALAERLLRDGIKSIKIHDGFLTDYDGDMARVVLASELYRYFGVNVPTTVKSLKRNFSVISEQTN